MTTWTHIATHRYRIDGDVLWWDPAGPIEKPHAEQLIQVIKMLAAHRRPLYILANVGNWQPMSPEIRKVYAQGSRNLGIPLTIITYGTLKTLPVTARLLLRAIFLLTGQDFRIHQTPTQETALALLAELKKRKDRPATPGE